MWASPRLAACSAPVASAVIGVLTHCAEGPQAASAAAGRGATGRSAAAPDAGLVQQIVEMGFTQRRAEDALRRVFHLGPAHVCFRGVYVIHA